MCPSFDCETIFSGGIARSCWARSGESASFVLNPAATRSSPVSLAWGRRIAAQPPTVIAVAKTSSILPFRTFTFDLLGWPNFSLGREFVAHDFDLVGDHLSVRARVLSDRVHEIEERDVRCHCRTLRRRARASSMP